MIRIADVEEQEEEKHQSIDPADDYPTEEQDFHAGKIYCANCIHCKLVPEKSTGDDRYVLRIRCAAGKWKKKLGEEKLYKYCTITRRYLDNCDTYEEMGDTRTYIRELKKSLPEKDELYVLFQGTEE
ncbi:hypothetical protein [Treponema primitia]|uniref:hypothetical protein n=1 Tax=Treponema primitia TaxID=88058 RepID=UPI0002554D43|nr:hypothetical protein [Treponema primitia]